MTDSLKFIIELIGTFFFISIVLNALNDSTIGPWGISIGLLASIYFGGKISGGHFNPAVSIAMYLKNNNFTFNLLLGYIIFQLIGAGLAVKLNTYILQNMDK